MLMTDRAKRQSSVTDVRRKTVPPAIWALPAKNHRPSSSPRRSASLGSVALRNARLVRELLLLAFFGLDAILDKFNEHAVGTEPPGFGRFRTWAATFAEG